MDDKRIKEIMKDPNTWEWDGCTYSDINTKESWEDKFLEELKKQTKE